MRFVPLDQNEPSTIEPSYTFVPVEEAAEDKGFVASLNETVDSALTFLPDGIENRINAVRGRSKRESVLEDKVLDDPSFDAAEAQRLSRRDYAERSAMQQAQKNSPSMRADTGNSLPANDKGILGRAADMAESQARGAAAGAAQLGADALDVVGADDAARALQTSARGNQRLTKNISAANELRNAITESDASLGGAEKFADKYAPQILAQLPQVGLAMISGGVTLPSVLSGLGSYADAREQGRDPLDAATYAIAMGGMEAIGEKLGGTGKLADAFEDALSKGFTKDAAVALGKQAMKTGAMEVPSEEITYFGQTGVGNMAGINPVTDFGDFAKGAVDTAIVAAGAGGMIGGAGAIATQVAGPKSKQDLLARELSRTLDGGEFTPTDFVATPNPNLTNTQPTERERITAQRQQAQAAIATAATPDEAVAAFKAATQTSATETSNVDPIALTPSTDLLAKAEAELIQQESVNGAAASVLPPDSTGVDAAIADAGLGVGAGDGAGLQPGVAQGVVNSALLDTSAGVPAGTVDGALSPPSESRGVFQTKQAADLYVQANGLAGQAEVRDTGSGFAVEPIQGVANGTEALRDTVRPATGGVGAGAQPQNNDAGTVSTVGAGAVGAVERAAAQAKYDTWRARHLASVAPENRAAEEEANPAVRFDAPDAALEEDARRVISGISGILSIDPKKVAFFNDPDANAPNGLAYNGVAWINTNGLQLDATQTGLHEGHHILERIAEAHDRSGQQNTPEQNYRNKTHGLFDGMSEDGKRSYVTKFLFKPQLDALRQQLVRQGQNTSQVKLAVEAQTQKYMKSATLRSEMAADFVGNRHNDTEFLESLAKADPKGFKSVITNWLDLLKNISKQLLGMGGNSEAAAIDSYFVNGLEDAKTTLRDALITLKNRGVDVGPALNDPLLADGPAFSRGVIAEVAPNPDTEEGAQWREMQTGEREQATRGVANKTVQRVFDALGLKGWGFKMSSGTYQGERNPNILVDAPTDATLEQLDQVANALGYVYDQKAMVSYADDITEGDDLSSFVKLVPPATMSTKQVNELREWVAKQVPQVDADTLMNGQIVIGNFSAYDDKVETLDDVAFREAISTAVASFPWGGEPIQAKEVERYHSKLIWPNKRDDYLKGFDDGTSDLDQAQPGDGRTVLRGSGQGGVLTQLTQIGQEAGSLRQQWIDASQSGKQRAQERRRVAATEGATADSAGAEYGVAKPNAVAAVGVHFSQAKRAVLSSAFYGQGIKGLEAERLSDPANADIKPRLFFYVDAGKGVTPEAGLGSFKHTVKLNNLYDVNADSLGIVKNTRGGTAAERASLWERKITQAGFDGYLADTGGQQNFAVLVGKHEVAFSRRFKSVDDFVAMDNGEADDFAFNIDTNDDVYKDVDAKLEKQEELQAELVTPVVKAPPKPVTLADMQQAGLFPESLFAEALGEVVETYDGNVLRLANAPIGNLEKNRNNELFRVSVPDSWLNDAPKDAGLKFMQQQLVKKRIAQAGYDLASAYKKGTVLKLVTQWQKLAGKPGLFKLPDSGKSKAFLAISLDMKAFPDYKVETNGDDMQFITFTRKTTGDVYQATIQKNSDKSFECCTMGLRGSGDLGSRFYAVTSEYARLNGERFMSAQTLSGINSARRTEQALSYALKTGDTGVILPGAQNRVYGYKIPKTQEDHAMNLGRLLLASLRNAVEVDPNIRRLNYQPDTDTFTDAKGNDATAKVEAFLKNPAARAFGMGRTTLARAVLTSQMLAGKFNGEGVTGFKTPIAYSRKKGMDSALSEAAGEPGDMDPNFEAWFADSKVVDEAGNPLVVYHGTTKSFDAFSNGTGWFTSDPGEANFWGGVNSEGANVVPAYMALKNPRVLQASEASRNKIIDALEALRGDEDGVIVMEDGTIRWAVAADPIQIKSVFNKGAWSKDDERISYSRKQLQTPQFQKWFGDSKVIDASGQPMVVYHGTGDDFDSFRMDGPLRNAVRVLMTRLAGAINDRYSTRNAKEKATAWFTSSPDLASEYAEFRREEGGGGNVMPVYISMQRPLVLDHDAGTLTLPNGRTLDFKVTRAAIYNNEGLLDLARTNKADGLIIRGSYDGLMGQQKPADVFVAFQPEQIKSATGNNGNYDLDDERISYARKLKKADGTVYDYDAALAVKFERIRRLTDDHPALMTRIDEDADRGVEMAKVLRLMMYTGFRVGGNPDLSGKHQAFGASTLKPEHVRIEGDEVHFDFIGKAGVRQKHSIKHPKIARDIEGRLDQPKLFKATDRGMRKYHDAIIGDKDYKLHDYRTWVATEAARRVVETIPAPTTPAEFWVAYDLAGQAAASKIGDTLKVALESYVEPSIFQGFRESSGVPEGSRRSDSKTTTPKPAADAGLDGEVLQPAQEVTQYSRKFDERLEVAPLLSDLALAVKTQGTSHIDRVAKRINDWRKKLEAVNDRRVQDELMEIGTRAVQTALDSGAQQFNRSAPVPIGATPHALRMLGWPMSPLRTDSSILGKIFKKHSEDFADVSAAEFVDAIYHPLMMTQMRAKDEVEIATRLISKTTGLPITFIVKRSTAFNGQANENGSKTQAVYTDAVKSAYSREQFWRGELNDAISSKRLQYVDLGALSDLAEKNPALGRALSPTGLAKQPDASGLTDAVVASAPADFDPDIVATRERANVSIGSAPSALVGRKAYRTIERLTQLVNTRSIKGHGDLVNWIAENYQGDGADMPQFARKFAQATQGNSFVLPGETKFSATRRALQDYFLPMLEVQQALLKQGGVIGEAQDVYRAEERMYGRIQETLKDFNEDVFTPMIEDAVANGINPDELALYAYAMHAPERNAHIAKIDKRLQDGGSGMTNQEAADIIAAFTAEGKLAALQVAHNTLMSITATTRRTQLEEDLITQEEYDALEAQYEYYIPLRGFADLDEDDQPTGVKRGGRGFNIRGNENMRALGRTSRAGDLIENVAIDYEKAIVRGERNTVGKVFLDLVQNNPDDALWQIDAVRTRKAFDRATGKIARNTIIDSGPDTVAVKVGGKEVYIKVGDERLLRALRMAYKDDTGAVASFLNDTVGLYSTLMRNTLTRYNPAFAAVNAVRDFGSGSAAVIDELGFKGQALYMKHYAGATRASWRNERNTQKNDDWGKWFEEFRAAGATTGGYYARSAEEINQDIRDVMLINGAAPKGKIELLKAKGGYKTIKKLGHVLEVLGSTSENAARVAAYRTAREMGKSPAEAASIAKNLTTNFNRKGEWGQVLNTLFVFYNAAVQGTARTLKALKNPKVQGLMVGAAAAGFAMAMANAGWGGDDEDGEAYWDKIADFEKERNFIIMLTPGMDVTGAEKVGKHGRYIKIPMPYGFNIFPMFGQQLADVYRHSKDEARGLTVGQASVNWFNAIMGSFNPLGGAIDPASGTSWLMAAMPSIGDLGVQMAAGINAFDKPTAPYKSEYDSGLDSENVNPRQAGGIAHKLARGLNKATGGNEVEAGFMDVAPGTLENLWRNATGGTGVFISDLFLNLPSKLLSEDATVTTRDIPVLKSFFAPVDELNDASRMYDRRREIMEAVATQKRYDDADMDKAPNKDFEALLSLGKSQARYTKQLSAMRKEEIELALDETISDKERNLKLKEIKLERAEAITEFNTEFMDAMRAKRDGEFGKK